MWLERKDEPADFAPSIVDTKLVMTQDGKQVLVSHTEAQDMAALERRRQQVTSFKAVEKPATSDTETVYQSAESEEDRKFRQPVPKSRVKIKDISKQVKAAAKEKPGKGDGYFRKKFKKTSNESRPGSLIYTDYKLIECDGKKKYVSPEVAEAIQTKNRIEGDVRTFSTYEHQNGEQESLEGNLEPTQKLFQSVESQELETPEELHHITVEQSLPAVERKINQKRPSIFSSFLRRKKKTTAEDGLDFEKLDEKASVQDQPTRQKRRLFSWLSFSKKTKPAVSESDLKTDEESPPLRRNFSLPVIFKRDKPKNDEDKSKTTADENITINDKNRDKKHRTDKQPNSVLGLIAIFGSQEDNSPYVKTNSKIQKKGVSRIGANYDNDDDDDDNDRLKKNEMPSKLKSFFGTDNNAQQAGPKGNNKSKKYPEIVKTFGEADDDSRDVIDLMDENPKEKQKKPKELSSKRPLLSVFGSGDISRKKINIKEGTEVSSEKPETSDSVQEDGENSEMIKIEISSSEESPVKRKFLGIFGSGGKGNLKANEKVLDGLEVKKEEDTKQQNKNSTKGRKKKSRELSPKRPLLEIFGSGEISKKKGNLKTDESKNHVEVQSSGEVTQNSLGVNSTENADGQINDKDSKKGRKEKSPELSPKRSLLGIFGSGDVSSEKRSLQTDQEMAIEGQEGDKDFSSLSPKRTVMIILRPGGASKEKVSPKTDEVIQNGIEKENDKNTEIKSNDNDSINKRKNKSPKRPLLGIFGSGEITKKKGNLKTDGSKDHPEVQDSKAEEEIQNSLEVENEEDTERESNDKEPRELQPKRSLLSIFGSSDASKKKGNLKVKDQLEAQVEENIEGEENNKKPSKNELPQKRSLFGIFGSSEAAKKRENSELSSELNGEIPDDLEEINKDQENHKDAPKLAKQSKSELSPKRSLLAIFGEGNKKKENSYRNMSIDENIDDDLKSNDIEQEKEQKLKSKPKKPRDSSSSKQFFGIFGSGDLTRGNAKTPKSDGAFDSNKTEAENRESDNEQKAKKKSMLSIFGSAPSVYNTNSKTSKKREHSVPRIDLPAKPLTRSSSNSETVSSFDSDQEGHTGFYDFETCSTSPPGESLSIYNPRRSYPVGIWGPRKRSKTENYCFLGDEPERIETPDLVLQGFKKFDDNGDTLLRANVKLRDKKKRPVSSYESATPKTLSVRRLSFTEAAHNWSDTESADHGSTDKTSVTKLTQDESKKRKFSFLEMLKRNKEREPTVIAEIPKEIVTDANNATNGDRVVYAELDMVRGIDAAAALRRETDPDKTEYAEIIHPNPPISKKEELRRSRENLVDPTAATPSGKKEAAV